MNLIFLDKKQLESFVASQNQAQFLQSWEWGEFSAVKGKVWRLGVELDGQLVAVVSLLKKPLLLGWSYFYSPRGPLMANGHKDVFAWLCAEIKKLAKAERVIFWRCEPAKMLADKNLVQTIDIQPRQTLLIDLSQSETDLLAGMHQKTRYNIRLAEKKGVVIKHDRATYGQAGAWWQLLSTTSKRDNFKLHSQKYYERMLSLPFVELWRAEYQGEILAEAIIAYYGDTVTYIHGASANANRQLMAPYLLHWAAIKWAKQNGFKYYDFYGVDERRWPGVSRFKLGFGGQIIKYSGTFDLVFVRLYYWIYQILRKLRRKL